MVWLSIPFFHFFIMGIFTYLYYAKMRILFGSALKKTIPTMLYFAFVFVKSVKDYGIFRYRNGNGGASCCPPSSPSWWGSYPSSWWGALPPSSARRSASSYFRYIWLIFEWFLTEHLNTFFPWIISRFSFLLWS